MIRAASLSHAVSFPFVRSSGVPVLLFHSLTALPDDDDRQPTHNLQAKMIEALGKYKPKDANLAIGLEMVRVCTLRRKGEYTHLIVVLRFKEDLTSPHTLWWNATTPKQVQQQFQPALDAYVARTISDETAAESALADATEWDDRWPEPLETYAPILRLAREKGYALLALGVDSEALIKVQQVGRRCLGTRVGLSISEKDEIYNNDRWGWRACRSRSAASTWRTRAASSSR